MINFNDLSLKPSRKAFGFKLQKMFYFINQNWYWSFRIPPREVEKISQIMKRIPHFNPPKWKENPGEFRSFTGAEIQKWKCLQSIYE